MLEKSKTICLTKKAILAREKIKKRCLIKKLFSLDKELKQYG